MTDPILKLNGVTKRFGGLVAVDEVSFDVKPERIVGLIGPNGAGKTTLLNLLSGFYDLDTGQITLDGKQVEDLSPYKRARLGMVRTFQRTRELTGLTVFDNLLLAAPAPRTEQVLPQFFDRGGVVEAERKKIKRAERWLSEMELEHLRDEHAGNLSAGQQKLLELGRALMANPDVLLLDEPMAGVNPALESRLLEVIKSLRADGCTFIIIEHDIEMIMSVSDRIVALHNGRVLTQGDPETVRGDKALLDAYLGGKI